MAFKGFSGNSGPVAPPKTIVSFGTSRPRSPSDSSVIRTRSVSPQPRPRPRPANHAPESSNADEEHQREMEAKARRLARFNTDLVVQEQKRGKEVAEADQAMDYESSDALADAILGSCSDMCPELEREERERKGDLDKFERLNGDRNLTNKFLAVKKYNRTAEREASLIRPLPVLQMTVDHLLKLIDRPYDDDFLSINNFLWDRMRAIRMDLRMQHIFNRDAITMHEQMIRFHIVAMHELCEYAKGEGFSEGFDAHLNLEQMNKTSVELFQMYDDHRKQGSPVSTEPEFRGYYALLKLDKHPGYKVEAAELSLDLANMTSEIRNTNEVLFAREVARASRSGNYIAFFRLARKATYLQACLMHAHFAKLRTQALASLHGGLQKNQGIPVAQIVKWLGMEGEDVEGFLEYHGFSLKQYEDMYMVKEGPFLNSERDFPTKCSQLVHQKRSTKVVDDVISSGAVPVMESTWHAVKALNDTVDRLPNRANWSHASVAASAISPEEEMADYEEDQQHSNDGKAKEWQMQEQFDWYQTKEVPHKGEVHKLPVSSMLPNLRVEHALPRSGTEKHALSGSMPLHDQQPKKKFRNEFSFEQTVQDSNRRLTLLEDEHLGLVPEMEVASVPLIHGSSEWSGVGKYASCVVSSEAKYHEEEEEARLTMWKAEAESAKLKLYLRRWQRRAMKKAQSRRLHQIKVDAALSSLFLGPPIRPSKEMTAKEENVVGIPRGPAVELSIDHVLRERHSRHEKMWSRLDVPEIIASNLSKINPHAQCLCWKLVICSRTHDKVGDTMGMCKHAIPMVGQWLHAKLMGDAQTNSEGLVHSSSDLVIWRKWVGVPVKHVGTPDLCILSILKDMPFNVDRAESEHASQGASGLLFLLVEDVQWDLERARLQSLVRTIPPGSRLPLLILSSGNVGGRGSMSQQADECSDSSLIVTIEKQLELSNLDRTRISSWVVSIIMESQHNDGRGFFDDDCLTGGLEWLACQAPLQPIIYPSDVRDLVWEYLGAYLKILLNGKPTEVMPTHCVHVFNEALDRTASEIVSAAQESLPGWPAPEINLLDENVERDILKSCLPSSGWNKAPNFENIIHALRLCRLPEFPSFGLNTLGLNTTSCGVQMQEFSSLKFQSGSGTLDEVEEQKIALEKSLYQYLSELNLTRKGGDLMALREADLMVQKCTAFECNGLRHLIIPKWASIFQRIYNWRLMILASEPPLIAYVSRPRNIDLAVNEVKHLLSCARQIFMTSGCSYEMEHSLSDMVDVGYRSIPRGARMQTGMQILKDHFLWHSWELNPESAVENVNTEMPQYSLGKRDGQHKIQSIQVPAMNDLTPVEGHVREVEYCISDPDDVQHLIEFPQTQGECQLDQAMANFCKKVDEQKRWTAMGSEAANVMNLSDIAVVADQPSVNESALFVKNGFLASAQLRRLQSSVSESLPSHGVDCRMTERTPSWATNDGMNKLNELVDQCSTIQRSIDKKLALYFKEKNGVLFA